MARSLTSNPVLKDYIDGLVTTLPLQPGVLPFGIVTGVVAAKVGMPALLGISKSAIVFAGSSELAISQLVADNALPLTMILTALVINLRLSMYSASIAPHFRTAPAPLRFLISYLLTDQSYALCIIRFNAVAMTPEARVRFYLGGAIFTWLIWMGSVTCGFFVGAQIPQSWGLDFIVPLSFLTLLVPIIRDNATFMAAIAGGVTAIVFYRLPFNLGLFLGATAGMLAGYLVEKRKPKPPAPQQEENE